jgi:hypothetical protein
MRADHEDPLVVPEHPELVLQRDRTAGRRRFELGVKQWGRSEGAEQNPERPERGTAVHEPGLEWTGGN